MGYFSDILERQTSPWRLLLGKGTDRDKEILEEEKTKGLEALLTATKPFRMGANVLAQGYGPALRALMGRDPSTPGGLESLIREGVSTEEQDYLERKPYTAALKSGAGMTTSLMPFATGGFGTLNYVANPLINKSLQYGLSGGVPGALGGFSYSGEGNELRDTLLGGGIGAATSLLGGYVFDPSYRELVNEAYRGAVPAGSQYEAALSLGKEDPAFLGKPKGQGDIEDLTPEQERTLVAVHNLSEDKLKGVEEIGGMPNPSIAVFDPENYDFEGYGDISLIAPEDLLFSEKARTFGADIYSPRRPHIVTKIDISSLDELAKNYPKYDFSLVDAGDIGNLPYDTNLLEQFIKNEKGIDLDSLGDYTQKSKLREKFRSEFESFAEKLLEEANAKKVLWGGYTPSGNPRYIEDFDAETISKIMNKEGLRGGDNFSYGLGNIRANLAPEFRSVEDIKANKDLLVGSTEFEKIKDSYTKDLLDITEELTKHRKYKDSNPFTNFSETSELLGEYLSGDNTVLQRSFEGVPESLTLRISEFGEKLSKMPTEYFETKFGRPVGVREFSHALVPEKVSEGIKNYLRDQGVNVVEYTGSQSKALLDLVREQGLLFGLGALTLGGLFQGEKNK